MNVLDTAMRAIASSLQYPVIAILIALAAVVVVLLGATFAEFFAERRRFKAEMPRLVDALELEPDTVSVIVYSGLLKRQKGLLLELCRHAELCDGSREALAANLLEREQARYDARCKVSDYIAKASPLFGLMGTLIPLGPGLIALGQGDTQTLSESLLMAFDTTIMGLATAAIALLVSMVRKHWYAGYMGTLEECAEVVLTRAAGHREFAFAGGEGAADGGNVQEPGKAQAARSAQAVQPVQAAQPAQAAQSARPAQTAQPVQATRYAQPAQSFQVPQSAQPASAAQTENPAAFPAQQVPGTQYASRTQDVSQPASSSLPFAQPAQAFQAAQSTQSGRQAPFAQHLSQAGLPAQPASAGQPTSGLQPAPGSQPAFAGQPIAGQPISSGPAPEAWQANYRGGDAS